MPRTGASERAPRPASGPGRLRQPQPTTGPVPRLIQLGAALGNRATTALLGGGFLQRKLAIGPADDPLEREADQVARKVLSAPEPEGASIETAPTSPAASGPVPAAARRPCAGCSAGHPCAECAAAQHLSEGPAGTVQRRCASCEDQEDELQRDAAGGELAGDVSPREVESHLGAAGPGQPLPPAVRGFFEPRFDRDFSAVRLHTGSSADAAARAARARAFTLGNDVVFAAGEYAPSLGRGRGLIAHELAHVVQQEPEARRRPRVRRKPGAAPEPAAVSPAEPSAAEEATTEDAGTTPETRAPSETEAAAGGEAAAPRGLIVADDAQPGPEQMTRTAFLDELQTAACSAADAGLAGTDRSSRGCPWIDHYFRLYREMSADRIEADLLRYVPGARAARQARDYIAPAAEHIRTSVQHWAETGELTGVPEGLPGMGLLGALGGSLAGLGRLLFKARSGGATSAAPPAAVAASLGSGSSFSGTARSRMEGAFGTALGDVRLHTDATASRLASRFNARAFTVGPHVAFGAGEFRPGTLAGDALLAHELAHVLQQDSEAAAVPVEATAGLEQDADRAAADAAARLLGHGRAGKGRPLRRTALRLQRCSSDKKVKGRPGMGLATGLAPGVETESYSMAEYIRMWEQAAGRRMSDEERRRLAAGCVGITRLNLGGAASLSECYNTFDQAKKRADELQAQLGKRPFIFSKRFWSMGAAYTPDPTTGKVEMSGYTGATPPGEVNFDYGWYDEVNNTWWHANHCDPVIAGGTCAAAYGATERMEVYQSTLAHYSDPNYFGADVQVFCVAWSQLQ